MSLTKSVGPYTYNSATDRIGRGSFAVVYKARITNGEASQVFAIKRVNRSRLNEKLQENLDLEIEILKKISHPNIVRLYETYNLEDNMYLVMEYCSGGDLAKYIKEQKKVALDVIHSFMQQISSALEFLRVHDIVHRDLKPQNLLLIFTSKLPIIKIADFGFARYLLTQDLAATLCGSPLYMAPEILSAQPYDAKADLWSVGTIIYECLVGSPPFKSSNYIELLKTINLNHSSLSYPADAPPLLVSLLQGLLKPDPLQRITFEEMFLHPYLQFDTFQRPNSFDLPSNIPSPDKKKSTQSELSTGVPSQLQSNPKGPANQATPSQIIPFHEHPGTSRSLVNDHLGEKEYVIVEKDFVEVNTFADAIEAFPTCVPTSIHDISFTSHSPSPAVYGSTPPFALTRSPPDIRLPPTAVNFSCLASKPPPVEWNPLRHSSISLGRHSLYSSSTALGCGDLLLVVSKSTKRGDAVIEVAKSLAEYTNDVQLLQAESYLLYVKAIELYLQGLNFVKEHMRNLKLPVTPELNDAVQNLRSKFNSTLEMADTLKPRGLETQPFTLGIVVEKAIYEHVVNMCKEAASHELSSNWDICQKLYTRVLILLDVLFASVKSMPENNADRKAIVDFSISVAARLNHLSTEAFRLRKFSCSQ